MSLYSNLQTECLDTLKMYYKFKVIIHEKVQSHNNPEVIRDYEKLFHQNDIDFVKAYNPPYPEFVLPHQYENLNTVLGKAYEYLDQAPEDKLVAVRDYHYNIIDRTQAYYLSLNDRVIE